MSEWTVYLPRRWGDNWSGVLIRSRGGGEAAIERWVVRGTAKTPLIKSVTDIVDTRFTALFPPE